MKSSDLPLHFASLGAIAALSAVLAMGSPAIAGAQGAESEGEAETDAAAADGAPVEEEAPAEAPPAEDEGAAPAEAEEAAGDDGAEPADGEAPAPTDALAAPPPSAEEDEAAPALAAPSPEAAAPEEAAEAPAEEAPPPARPEPRVWRNSFFFWSNNVSAYTFLPNTPNAPDTYNPFYEWSFSLQPRWYVGPSLFLRVRQNARIEWTQTDFRVRERELVFDDTFIDLLEGNLARVAGITFSLGGRAILPTSIVSQNNTMLFGAGLIGLARYSFREVLNGMTVIVSTAYTYRHFDKNTGQFQDGADYDAQTGNRLTPLSSGFQNAPHSYGLGLSAVVAVTNKLFLSGSFSWSRNWATRSGAVNCDPSQPDADNPVCDVPASTADNRRDNLFFSIGGSYQFNKWLNLGLSMSTPTNLTIPGFDDRNPIWNYGTTFSLTTQVTLDQLYSDLFERQEGGDVPLPGQAF